LEADHPDIPSDEVGSSGSASIDDFIVLELSLEALSLGAAEDVEAHSHTEAGPHPEPQPQDDILPDQAIDLADDPLLAVGSSSIDFLFEDPPPPDTTYIIIPQLDDPPEEPPEPGLPLVLTFQIDDTPPAPLPPPSSPTKQGKVTRHRLSRDWLQIRVSR